MSQIATFYPNRFNSPLYLINRQNSKNYEFLVPALTDFQDFDIVLLFLLFAP